MALIKRYIFLVLVSMSQLISCSSGNNEFYDKKEIEIYSLITQNNRKYLIFKNKFESSLNWPENALCEYNSDSTKVKLSIKRYNAILYDRKPDSNSNIQVVRNCVELKLNYQNTKDSLLKSSFYVLKLPISVSEVKL